MWNWIKAGDLQELLCNATTGSSSSISSSLLHDSNWNQGAFSYTVMKKLLVFDLFCFGSIPPQIFVISQEEQGFCFWKKEGKDLHKKKQHVRFGHVNSPHEHLNGSAVSVERVIKLVRALGCFDKSR